MHRSFQFTYQRHMYALTYPGSDTQGPDPPDPHPPHQHQIAAP